MPGNVHDRRSLVHRSSQSIPCSRSSSVILSTARSGLRQHASLVGEPEDLGIVRDLAGGLEAARHDEVALRAVKPGEEGDAGLVETGGRLEDFAAERDGRGKERVVGLHVAFGERLQRLHGGWRDRSEGAEQRVAVARAVASDQLGIVEVVAGVEPDALGEPGAECLLVRLVEQRDLDAVDLGGVRLDDRERGVGGRIDVARTPVALERRIEHVAEPVQDDRRLGVLEQLAVDAEVNVGVGADRRKRPRRHQDHLATRRLDRLHLLGIGGDQPGLVADLARAFWSVPAPQATRGFSGCAFASRIVRSINSFAVGQSTPMPRCAVSIASARPSPWSQSQRRKPRVFSQSTDGLPIQGSRSAIGSDTTCAAAKAVRVSGTRGGAGHQGSPIGA